MEVQTSFKTNIKETVPFFHVKDMDHSLIFYRDQLGFQMTHSWIPEEKIRWCNIHRDGANLMLQEYLPEFLPQNKRGEGISICFMCEDALELYHEFKSNGVDIKEPFVGNNMWVIELTDPDGYKLCFESFTDVPEGTTYNDWNR
jgi:lactoylglutathione lyase